MSARTPKTRANRRTVEAESSRPIREQRFHQLLDLAREGDLGAIAELWNCYGYRFPEDEP